MSYPPPGRPGYDHTASRSSPMNEEALMPESGSVTRRTFLERSATTAAVTLVSRHVLGGPRHVPPSDRINVAYVGCGTQGLRQLMPALQRPDLRITAVCDPNRRSEDYVEWFRFELRDKIRAFLRTPAGPRGRRPALAGARSAASSWTGTTARRSGAGCHAYADFRELLAKEKDLDAVYIMTPDHLHATVALAAMKAGKHVIVHKPLGNVFHEARLVIQTARETGAATHMFCAAGTESTPQITEWIQAGRHRPRARGAQLVLAALLAAGHDEPARPRRCRCRTGSTGTSGWGPCRTGPITRPTRTRSSAAGTTSAPAPSATWGTTASSRSSRS